MKLSPASRVRAALLALSATLAASTGAVAGELTIYSSVEGDNLKAFAAEFAKDNPDIKINWVRDSTGVLQARLVAEKDNPRNDVVFGHAATSLLALDQMGLLAPYTPKDSQRLDPRFRDKRDPAHWTGMWGFASAVCFNTVEAAKLNLPRPTKWEDLTNPVYRGQITMPNPVSSGTGFLNVSGWLQMFGPEKAWAFMDGLHQNIAAYSHSGSKPCEQVATGEYVVGISLPWRALSLAKMGAPIDVVFPEEGIGWEMQGVAIMKNTGNMADAQRFADWAVSPAAMAAYGKRVEVVAAPVEGQASNVPAELSERMIDNDFAWAAQNQQAILTEWRARYDGKTEPKK